MNEKKLTHPDWTDKQCANCKTTLTKQELVAGKCIVCKMLNINTGADGHAPIRRARE